MTAELTSDLTSAELASAELHLGLAEGTPLERAAMVAERFAGPAADDVDQRARFPREAVDAMKAARLLSLIIPTELGGEGLTVEELTPIIEQIGRHCASSAMIFAMHQIQVACLVKHGRNSQLRELVSEIAEGQLLVASATTEIGIGGDVRSSSCAVEQTGARFSLEKNAPVISYGASADIVLATARRTPDSPPSDQVLVACRRADVELTQTSEWDTLGFRGTCSPGFMLKAQGPIELILDDPYGEISAQTMLPVSHTVWSAVWLGIASAAVAKARQYVQAAARSKPGMTPPGALRLAELNTEYQQFQDLVRGAGARYTEACAKPDIAGGIGYAIAMNTVKLSASSLVIEIVGKALMITGIAGYREDSGYRMGRLLRDAYGAGLMVNNDRILNNSAQLMLVYRESR